MLLSATLSLSLRGHFPPLPYILFSQSVCGTQKGPHRDRVQVRVGARGGRPGAAI